MLGSMFSHILLDRSQQNPVDGIAIPFQLNIEHADPFGSLKGLQYHLLPRFAICSRHGDPEACWPLYNAWLEWFWAPFVACFRTIPGLKVSATLFAQLFNRAGTRSLSTIVQKSYQKIPDHSVCKSLEVHLPDEFLSTFGSGVKHPWEPEVQFIITCCETWFGDHVAAVGFPWDGTMDSLDTTCRYQNPNRGDMSSWLLRCGPSIQRSAGGSQSRPTLTPSGQLVGISSSQRSSLWERFCQVNWHSKMVKSHQWFTFSHPAMGGWSWVSSSFVDSRRMNSVHT